MLSVIMPNAFILNIVMLSVIMPGVFIMNIVKLSVIMMSNEIKFIMLIVIKLCHYVVSLYCVIMLCNYDV
jgi:hypothetical protein